MNHSNGHYFKPVMIALSGAGYEIARRSGRSHLIMKAPGRPVITMPPKLDDVHVAKKIVKVAGVNL